MLPVLRDDDNASCFLLLSLFDVRSRGLLLLCRESSLLLSVGANPPLLLRPPPRLESTTEQMSCDALFLKHQGMRNQRENICFQLRISGNSGSDVNCRSLVTIPYRKKMR